MKPLLIIAGEASGDLHGSEILKALKSKCPELRVVGIGGAAMSPLLDRKLADVKDLAVVGFVEVLKHLPALLRLKKEIFRVAREEGVGAALFIDYQSFNLNLAKTFRKCLPSVRLHQYVCPQVWAWKAGRIPVLGRTLDTLYCLFDFEPELFKGTHLEAIWVGNPLVEAVRPEVDREAFLAESGLDSARPIVAILPGSRSSEVSRLLPPMVELARRWSADPSRAAVQWVLPMASTLDRAKLEAMFQGAPIRLVEGRTYAARAYADAALVCSGTATLETALLGTPEVVLYKLSAITYAMARRVVKLPHFGLVNVVAGRQIAPELLQDDVNPDRLAEALERLLDPVVASSMRKEFSEVRARLGASGAAERVAEHLLAQMGATS
jgi:lipid-A-disaccharide synthase